jgi:6-methylsalicylate decarboxylase
MLCACTAFGADHVVVGSDFPVLNAYETYDRTINWIRNVPLPAAELDLILNQTAPRILGLGSSPEQTLT